MTKISPTSQRGMNIIRDWENSSITTLREAYPSGYSGAKEKAFAYCKDKCDELHGYGMTITGHNTFYFSVAFKYRDEDGNENLCYITHADDYYIPLGKKARKPLTLEDFEKRWEKVSPNIKAHTAKGLDGHCVGSMEEAEEILKMAEMFSAFETLMTK